MDQFADPSLLTNPLELEESSQTLLSQRSEDTEDDNAVKPSESDIDQMSTLFDERKDQNRVSVSPLKKQGILLLISLALIFIFSISSDLVINYTVHALKFK